MENEEITLYLDSNIHLKLKEELKIFRLGNVESSLIKRIVVNYYPKYNEEKSKLEGTIVDAIKGENISCNLSEDEYQNISWKIIKHLGEASISNTSPSNKTKKKDKIHLRINKNDDYFEHVLESCQFGISLSDFIANIIYSYFQEPRHQREKIIFNDVYKRLQQAIDNNQQVSINAKSNTRDTNIVKIIEPKKICVSKEGLYNYLLYKETIKGKERATSIHLYNISTVVLAPLKSTFSDEINNYFKRMEINGVQYSINSNTIYKVKFTKNGNDLYNDNLKYIERPVALDCSDKENGIYYFDCSQMQFENYFASFFNDIEILEPLEYKYQFDLKKQGNSNYHNKIKQYRYHKNKRS